LNRVPPWATAHTCCIEYPAAGVRHLYDVFTVLYNTPLQGQWSGHSGLHDACYAGLDLRCCDATMCTYVRSVCACVLLMLVHVCGTFMGIRFRDHHTFPHLVEFKVF
jgi:hypothetical protein